MLLVRVAPDTYPADALGVARGGVFVYEQLPPGVATYVKAYAEVTYLKPPFPIADNSRFGAKVALSAEGDRGDPYRPSRG